MAEAEEASIGAVYHSVDNFSQCCGAYFSLKHKNNKKILIFNKNRTLKSNTVNVRSSETAGVPRISRVQHRRFSKSGSGTDDRIYWLLATFHTKIKVQW